MNSSSIKIIEKLTRDRVQSKNIKQKKKMMEILMELILKTKERKIQITRARLRRTPKQRHTRPSIERRKRRMLSRPRRMQQMPSLLLSSEREPEIEVLLCLNLAVPAQAPLVAVIEAKGFKPNIYGGVKEIHLCNIIVIFKEFTKVSS